MRILMATTLLLATTGFMPVSAQQNESTERERPALAPSVPPLSEPDPAVLLGSFVDEIDGRPLQAVPVEIRDADGLLVAGALTNVAGRFRIEGLTPGRYSLRATSLGYAPVQLDSIALESGAVRSLDPVGLSIQAVELEGLSVTAERSEVRLEVDRTVFNARNAPSAAGGNATDVLRNVPSVDVDPEGRVSVRGSSDVVIQINGRPAPFKGDALAAYLKQLPASTIAEVEVIANPAAKYDPEGMAGIVNIVLRENTDLGLSAAITVAGGSADRHNGSGTLGYQQGRLNLAGMYSMNSDLSRPSGYMERLNFLGSGPEETIFQDSRTRQESMGHSFTGTLDFKVRPKTTLSFQASGNTNGNESLTINDFRLLAGEELLDREWLNATGTNRDLRSGDLVFGLKHAPTRSEEVLFEGRLSRAEDSYDSRYGDELLNQVSEFTTTETSTRDASLQLDLTRTVAGFKVETGARVEQRLIGTDFTREPLGEVGILPDQNAFDYDTRIYSGYAQASRGAGPLTLQAGLRMERADTRFDVLTESESYENRYTSLYPSASVVVDLAKGNSVRLGYSRRVRRPRTQQLNPFSIQTDSLSLRVGNPSLDPQYTNSFDLTFQTSGALGTLQLTPFYRVTTDLIQYFKTVDPQSGISTTTFRNFDRSSQYGLDLTATGRLGSRIRGMLGTNLAQVSTDAENLEAGLRSRTLSWSVRSSASLRLAPSTDLQGFVMYRAPRDIAQGRMRSFVVSNISLRHRILDGKGDIVLRMSDPFQKMNFGFYTSDEFHEQDFLRRIDAQKLTLSFSYAFGKPPRMRQAASQEMDMGIR
jgi:outer membrane receptor protein involved in Fe transport